MIFSLNSALIGPANERPAVNDPTVPRNGSTPPTYICIDTLDVFQDTGTEWLLVGTLGSSLPGVISDGLMPGGVLAQGGIATQQIPDPTTAPTLAQINDAGGLPAGTYGVRYDYQNDNGNTFWSPLASITLTETAKIRVTVPSRSDASYVNIYRTVINGSQPLWSNYIVCPGTTVDDATADGSLGGSYPVPFNTTGGGIVGSYVRAGGMQISPNGGTGATSLHVVDPNGGLDFFQVADNGKGVRIKGGFGRYGAAVPPTPPAITGALSTVADPAAQAVLTSIILALRTDGGATDSTS